MALKVVNRLSPSVALMARLCFRQGLPSIPRLRGEEPRTRQACGREAGQVSALLVPFLHLRLKGRSAGLHRRPHNFNSGEGSKKAQFGPGCPASLDSRVAQETYTLKVIWRLPGPQEGGSNLLIPNVDHHWISQNLQTNNHSVKNFMCLHCSLKLDLVEAEAQGGPGRDRPAQPPEWELSEIICRASCRGETHDPGGAS